MSKHEVEEVTYNPGSLVDLTSIIVSLHYPFQLIEERYKNIIPEPVQKSIIYHSFPKHESDVRVYASQEFNEHRYGVDQVVQIGFHLSGVVFENGISSSSSVVKKKSNKQEEEDNTHFRVSLTFDRGKITSVSCNCENEHSLIFWCDHVIALALHRIRNSVNGKDFVLRVPISETLLQLNRSQLQKLVQYLISDHTDVLPTAQRLADEILFMKTDDNYINRIHGAPDPTAGPSPSDPHSWALNEQQIQAQVRTYVNSSSPSNSSSSSSVPSPNVIQVLIEKVYKMLSTRDSNAERIIQIITNELVRHASKSNSSSRLHSVTWDQIIRVWNVIVLKPNISDADRAKFETIITPLARNEHLPECEEPDESKEQSQSKRARLSNSIFNSTLKFLKRETNIHDYKVMKLHSRYCHGMEDEEYALVILKSLRSPSASIQIEHAHVLFDVLKRSHPKQAFETALISLSQRIVLKHHAYVHEKHMKLVEKLIAKVIALNYTCQELLIRHAEYLLHDIVHPNAFPLISFATYLFNALKGNSLGYKIALKYLLVQADSFVHTHLEAQQISLASNLLSSAKHESHKLDEISNTIMRVVKSNTSLFRLAQEVFKHANHENLVSVSFNIALHVVKSTKYTVHRRRWEMVRWVVSCGVEIGVAKLFYLVRNWGEYFSPVEAVGTVASNILTWVVGGTGSNTNSTNVIPGPSKLNNHDKRLMEELANAARNLAIQCAKNDPQNCALNTLTLCENDPMAFETSYQIVLESASKEFLTPQQIFTIARYMEHRGYTQRAYRLAVIAVQHVHIGYNQDTHSLVSEIHWTCNLSHQLSTPMPGSSSNNSGAVYHSCGQPPCKAAAPAASSLSPPTSELESLIPLLIRNIKCATVLTEILRRSITIMTSYENAYQKEKHGNKKLKQRVYEKLSLLIEGTIDSYITTTHSRLVHISPRHYSDFIEFLTKARENFLLAPNGNERFKHLVESMKSTYKGKKKLLFLLTERFG